MAVSIVMHISLSDWNNYSAEKLYCKAQLKVYCGKIKINLLDKIQID